VSNTPTLREQREAHERRARVIDRLHAQATAKADQVLAQHSVIEAKIRAILLWRRARLLLIGLAFITFALASAFALVGMIAMAQ
jgi:hypothetical protein